MTQPLSGHFELKDISFSYLLGKQKVPALSNISLSVDRGEFVCLLGPSGSGKTTLLNLLGLIENVQKGKYLLDGQNVKELSEKERNQIRRFKLGFIFQTFQLFPVLNAVENVDFFLARQKVPLRERQERAKEALNAVGLWSHRTKTPLEMSGGQRQRVAIARALAKSPEFILADEPTASLDQATGRDIMNLLKELNETRKMTVVLCTHDPMAQSFARRKIALVDGKITDAKHKEHK